MEYLEAIGHAIMTGLKCLNEYIDIFTLAVAIFGARLLFKRTKIAETSQVNEQYIKSIEQLGKDSIAGRLGGIYGLEKVAQSQRFYKQVIEVLTAYVRQHAVEPKDETDDQPQKDKPVIQAILTVLGRLPRPEKNEETVRFDLSGSYLKGYTIKGDFSDAMFYQANLTEANCNDANFTQANCYITNFTKTKCYRTNFTRAGFWRANFTQANFSGAICREANFTGVNCFKANFTGVNCFGANFTGAVCIQANFTKADCHEADFTEAKCQGATGVTEAMKQAGAITEDEEK